MLYIFFVLNIMIDFFYTNFEHGPNNIIIWFSIYSRFTVINLIYASPSQNKSD